MNRIVFLIRYRVPGIRIGDRIGLEFAQIVSAAFHSVADAGLDVTFERAIEDTSEVDFPGQVS